MDRDTSFLKKSLIAHRGLFNNKDVPENTIKAFQKAVKKNYLIELDVHLLKDNNVVVFHDNNLLRMTGVNKPIKDYTYQEIKKIKLLDTNEHIPLLKDALNLIDGKVPVIIELKSDNKVGLLEEELVKLLNKYRGIYAIKSFNPKTVYYFKRKYPNIIRGLLVDNFKKNKYKHFALRTIFLTKPDFISCSINNLPSKKIKKLRNKKLILGWTVKSNEDLDRIRDCCDNYICENINELKNIDKKH